MVEGQMKAEKRNETAELARNRTRCARQELSGIRDRVRELRGFEQERQTLEQRCRMATLHLFFQSLSLEEAAFAPPRDSLVLTQEPWYFRVFDFYNNF